MLSIKLFPSCKRLLSVLVRLTEERLHNLAGKQGSYEIRNILELEGWLDHVKGKCLQTSLVPTRLSREAFEGQENLIFPVVFDV